MPIKPSFIGQLLNWPSLKWTRPSNLSYWNTWTMGFPAATRNSSGDMGVGNYSLKWRLLPLLVLPKKSLNNLTYRINIVIDYQK